jgi:hypothetical protein
MPTKLIAILKVVISVLLAVLLLYLVFKNIEWDAFFEKAKVVDYSWVYASIGLSVIAYWARAYRWNILLEPMGYRLKTKRTMLAVLVGYLANLAIPRLGEITRCGILNRNDGVVVTHALGSVVTERLVDLLSLLVLLLLGIVLEGDLLLAFLKQAYNDLQLPGFFIWILAGVFISILFAGYLFIRKQRKKGGKLVELINQFIDGIMSLGAIKRPFGFLLATLLLWIIYYLMAYIIVFALPETSHLDMTAGLLLLITGGIALALPVQSGFGTYHGMVAGLLLLYSVENTTGVFMATLLHTSQIIAIAFFGSVALGISFFIRKRNV